MSIEELWGSDDTVPHKLSVERLLLGADALRARASTYKDLPADDVSEAERHHLWRAVVLTELALDEFE